jgi:AraC family transcriptional regulator
MQLVYAPPGSSLTEPGRNAMLARLLTDAVEALECDTERARASLSRAAALIRETIPSVTTSRKAVLAPWQVKKTIALIDERLCGRTWVTELAANVNLSQSHFSRCFRTFFGRPPKRFILERRIEHSLDLMLSSDGRLCDIALACGFNDQAHFSRSFRKLMGLTPNAWRRAMKIR